MSPVGRGRVPRSARCPAPLHEGERCCPRHGPPNIPPSVGWVVCTELPKQLGQKVFFEFIES